MEDLYALLKNYGETEVYPFHMPGHKRSGCIQMGDPYRIDITEIGDFDDLNHPQGLFRQAMEEAAELYGTRRTWFHVNGSSGALLAALHAVTKYGDAIIIGRNCHKAVHNAVMLRGLVPYYVYPEYEEELALAGAVLPERLEEVWRQREKADEEPDAPERKRPIRAVVITSPTYEGIVSDVAALAEVAHRHGAVLIVDEAHGAHLPFLEKTEGLSGQEKGTGRKKAYTIWKKEGEGESAEVELSTAELLLVKEKSAALASSPEKMETSVLVSSPEGMESSILASSPEEIESSVLVSSPEGMESAILASSPEKMETSVLAFSSEEMEFPASALSQGADLVVQSLHKTMPALTQTALLHLCSDRVDELRVEEALRIFQTSSPSYVLSASIITCLRWAQEKKQDFLMYRRRLGELRREIAALSRIGLLSGEWLQQHAMHGCLDPSKLVLYDPMGEMSGIEIAQQLRSRFRLEVELAGGRLVLLMTSPADREEGFVRLLRALQVLEKEKMLTGAEEGKAWEGKESLRKKKGQEGKESLRRKKGQEGKESLRKKKGQEGEESLRKKKTQAPQRVCTPAQAEEREKEMVPLSEASGRVSGEYVYLYPPEIPLFVPGERITEEMVTLLETYRREGRSVRGCADPEWKCLRVLRKERE